MTDEHKGVMSVTFTRNWVAVPEIIYLALIIISAALCVLSLLFVARSLIKKKSWKCIAAWLAVLVVSVALLYLIIVAHFIVANTMVGG